MSWDMVRMVWRQKMHKSNQGDGEQFECCGQNGKSQQGSHYAGNYAQSDVLSTAYTGAGGQTALLHDDISKGSSLIKNGINYKFNTNLLLAYGYVTNCIFFKYRLGYFLFLNASHEGNNILNQKL